MNTTSRTRRIGPTIALLLGCALAVTPITAQAGVTDASERGIGSVRFVPSPDRGNLRQQLEADRGQTAPGTTPNLRQRMEADRGDTSAESRPNLRQRIEDDRTPAPVPPPRVVPNDTDPREHRQVRAPVAAPEVHVHLRILRLR